MNTKVFLVAIFVSLVFAASSSSPKEKDKMKKNKPFKSRRTARSDFTGLPSRPVLVRKAKTSNEPNIPAETASPIQSSVTDYSSSSNYDSTKSNSGLTEEELDSFGFIDFGNSTPGDVLINVEEDAPAATEEELAVESSNSQNNHENQIIDCFETFTDTMAICADQQNDGFYEISWDTEFEGQWCLGPVEFQQLRAASNFSNFEDFLSASDDTKITMFDGNLRVDLNWPEMGPTSPRPSALSVRFQTLGVYALVKDYPVHKLRKLVSDQVIDLERPIHDSSADIYRSFLSFAIDRDNRNLDKIDLIIQFMPQHMINKPDSKGVTPLEVAIIRNDLILVKKLVESGADMNIKTDSSNNTPFMRAIRSYNFDIVEYLIDTGKVDFFDGVDVLSLATIHLNSDLMQKALNFLSAPPNFKSKEFGKILQNIFENSLKTFEILVREIILKMKKKNLLLFPVLMAETFLLKDNFEMVKYLNSLNVPMNLIMPCKEYFQYRFIHIAAARGQLEMFKLLLSFGISPLKLTGTKKSLLYVAYKEKQFHIIEEILKMGVYSGLFDCLEHAFAIENLQMINVLLNSPLNLNELNFPSGRNLITKAIESDKPQIIEILIQSGKLNLYQPDQLCQTIYTVLIPGNASESLKKIIKREIKQANALLNSLL